MASRAKDIPMVDKNVARCVPDLSFCVMARSALADCKFLDTNFPDLCATLCTSYCWPAVGDNSTIGNMYAAGPVLLRSRARSFSTSSCCSFRGCAWPIYPDTSYTKLRFVMTSYARRKASGNTKMLKFYKYSTPRLSAKISSTIKLHNSITFWQHNNFWSLSIQSPSKGLQNGFFLRGT